MDACGMAENSAHLANNAPVGSDIEVGMAVTGLLVVRWLTWSGDAQQ